MVYPETDEPKKSCECPENCECDCSGKACSNDCYNECGCQCENCKALDEQESPPEDEEDEDKDRYDTGGSD